MKKMLAKINEHTKNTLMETLDIQFIEIGEGYMIATMPVGPKVHQPMGFLHGGASLALAESLGSCLSFTQVDPEKFDVFGLEISGNHVKAKRNGMVKGIAKLRNKGRTTHLVNIEIFDENENLISVVKMTNIIVPKKK